MRLQIADEIFKTLESAEELNLGDRVRCVYADDTGNFKTFQAVVEDIECGEFLDYVQIEKSNVPTDLPNNVYENLKANDFYVDVNLYDAVFNPDRVYLIELVELVETMQEKSENSEESAQVSEKSEISELIWFNEKLYKNVPTTNSSTNVLLLQDVKTDEFFIWTDKEKPLTFLSPKLIQAVKNL